MQVETPTVEAAPLFKKASIEATSEKTTLRKRKRYRNRQRRGFLGGIFRKKSGCGCPNI
jgi:hypothetical protein